MNKEHDVEPGYYWAKWKYEDGREGEWEKVSIRNDSIYRTGDDDAWSLSYFRVVRMNNQMESI